MAEITPIMSDSGSPSASLPSNTFDVHTNQRLCSVLLNEFNYLPWSRSVQLALGGRSKLEFIDKSTVVLMSILLNLWDAVKEMYGNQNNAARVFQLKRDIACLQQEGSVCATIQREEVRRKVMNCNLKTEVSEARAYMFNHKRSEERSYKGKRPELKCNHCHNLGHTVDRCWVLHPELKPKFPRENMPQKRTQPSGYKANHVTTMAGDELSSKVNLITMGSQLSYLVNLLDFYLKIKMVQLMTHQDLVTKKTIGEGFFFQGLYYLLKDFHKGFHVNACLASKHKLWHQRLAHPSESILAKIFPNINKNSVDCDICHLSKSTRLSFPSSNSRSNKLFELVHSDVWGPVLESFDGYKYFVTFVDDFSRFTWLYLLRSKSEVASVFQDFHSLINTQFSSKIKIL
ncbi:uncharacterized protein LOC120000736 [Tripterygium wilfordii]|uniref:uncharacterized protein LOC120000736 n=1 Tax=Tripterygium wilfordii TaxID=458696 RepID=UPI0018F82EE3|nr:uncharacterized protein LOC120000736 [Tripterygium wilfordii]